MCAPKVIPTDILINTILSVGVPANHVQPTSRFGFFCMNGTGDGSCVRDCFTHRITQGFRLGNGYYLFKA